MTDANKKTTDIIVKPINSSHLSESNINGIIQPLLFSCPLTVIRFYKRYFLKVFKCANIETVMFTNILILSKKIV